MLAPESLTKLTHEIMKQGFDVETASAYALRIGDVPRMDKDGNFIVLDDRGNELTRVKPLEFFKSP
jgi:hypothetical protein